MRSFRLPSRKVRRRLIGVAVAVAVAVAVLGVTIKVRHTWVGGRITECGVDAKGPYARVRVGSRWGGLGAVNHEGVTVAFTYEGHWYAYGGSTIEVPTFGSTTTFARGPWPPSAINPHWDGGPRGEPRIRVEGRVVSGHWVNTSVPLQRRWHIKPRFKVRVEPDDLSLLGCTVVAPARGWQ